MDIFKIVDNFYARADAHQKASIARFDRLCAENEKNAVDAKLGELEVRRSNDGWELVRYEAMTSGTPSWKRVAFSRMKKHVIDAIPMYQK